jgi:YHS domain-containing protein
MVTNKAFEKDQIPIEVEGRTYYGCCEMCKTALTNDPEKRTAIDLIGHLSYSQAPALAKRHKVEVKKTPRPRRGFSPRKSAHMTRQNSASCFWKSVFWIRRISDPPQAATTGRWTAPNAIEWILGNFKKPWRRNLLRNETNRRRQKQRGGTAKQRHSSINWDFRRSASLHSVIFH